MSHESEKPSYRSNNNGPQQPYNWQPPQPFYGNNLQQPQYPPGYYPALPPQPLYQQPPQAPQKKKTPTLRETWNSGVAGKCGVIVLCTILLLVLGLCSGVMHAATSDSSTTSTAIPTQPVTVSKVRFVSHVKPAIKPKPTAIPTPTQTSAQMEATYKASTTDTTVTMLDKDGNADQGTDEHFTCTIVAFVKDSSGNTAGANVTDTSGSFVQVLFTPGTDITQLNANDTLKYGDPIRESLAALMHLAQRYKRW